MSGAASPSRQRGAEPEDKPLGRVAFLTNILPPYRLPAIRVFAQHCGALRIFLSTVIEPNRSWDQEWAEFDVVVQNTVTMSRLWRHPHGFEDPLFVHIPLDTMQQLHRFAPDAILSGEMGFRTLLAAAYRRLRKNTVLLIWADVSVATEQGRGLARALTRRLLRTAADCFIVNGNSGQRYLTNMGVPEQKIFRVPFATDLQHFFCKDVQRSPAIARKLLYVGQFSKRKGLAPFIGELAQWCKSHAGQRVEFTLLGDGPLRPELIRIPVPANLQLTFLEPLPYSKVVNSYLNAGILVLPTLADTWGLVVNEGMAAGLPVLGSIFSPAVEEMVDDDVTGWTFCPGDHASLQSAIDRCLSMPADELERMRVLAQASAMRLSPGHVASLLTQAIRECTHTAGANSNGDHRKADA